MDCELNHKHPRANGKDNRARKEHLRAHPTGAFWACGLEWLESGTSCAKRTREFARSTCLASDCRSLVGAILLPNVTFLQSRQLLTSWQLKQVPAQKRSETIARGPTKSIRSGSGLCEGCLRNWTLCMGGRVNSKF